MEKWYNSVHCKSGVHCKACRNPKNIAFRADIISVFGSDAHEINFDCEAERKLPWDGPKPESLTLDQFKKKGFKACSQKHDDEIRPTCKECCLKHLATAVSIQDVITSNNTQVTFSSQDLLAKIIIYSTEMAAGYEISRKLAIGYCVLLEELCILSDNVDYMLEVRNFRRKLMEGHVSVLSSAILQRLAELETVRPVTLHTIKAHLHEAKVECPVISIRELLANEDVIPTMEQLVNLFDIVEKTV